MYSKIRGFNKYDKIRKRRKCSKKIMLADREIIIRYAMNIYEEQSKICSEVKQGKK